jgi:thymidylate synthase (FAD)
MTNNNELKGLSIPVLDKGYVRLIDWMGSDQRILEFARVSYKSPSKGIEQDTKLLHYLYKNKHTSPFEANKITLNIKMPIFVMRQYVRHRMQNLNEVSARYTELPNEFYIPTRWRQQDTKNKQGSIYGEISDTMNWALSTDFEKYCHKSYEYYQSLLKNGVAREMARMALPINIYTEIYCCWDLKNLMHFLQLREDSHAQFEIQEYAKAIKEIVNKLFPVTMEAFDKYKWKITE